MAGILRVFTLLICIGAIYADEEYSPRTKRSVQVPAGTTLRVVTILTAPYAMMHKESGSVQGFQGFIPDIMQELQDRVGFNYTMYAVQDGKYGSLGSDGKWSGMVGEVIKKQNGDPEGADIAAAPLTTSSIREAHIDFLKAFQQLGIVMVARKTSGEEMGNWLWHYKFTVISPLKAEVWVSCTISVLVVAVLLWLNNRYNPYEWGERHNIGRASETAAHSFSLIGSLWFTFSTLQWQGFERAPRSASSKLLTAFWFVFVTLTLLTYTGSLVNHLFWATTVTGPDTEHHELRSLHDLVFDDSYDYGTVKGGSTQAYFKNHKDVILSSKMTKYWSTARGENAMVNSYEEGLRRVRSSQDGKYVLLMENNMAEYSASRKPCDLQVIGQPFGLRHYAMAVPENMNKEISDALHSALLEMREDGTLDAIENEWWYERGECTMPKRPKESGLEVTKPKRVDINMFMGPLVLLIVGIVLALVVAIAEGFYYKTKGKHEAINQPGGQGKFDIDEDA